MNDGYPRDPREAPFQPYTGPEYPTEGFPQPGPQPVPPVPYGGRPPQTAGRPRAMTPQAGRGLAVASLTLGIIGFFTGFILVGLALDVIGIILGIVSLTSDRPGKHLAVSGILIGLLSILLTLLFYYFVGQNSSGTDPRPLADIPVEVTNLPSPSEAALMKNITLLDQDIGNGVLLIYENKNPMDVDLEIQVVYYDEAGNILFLREEYLMGCAAGGRAALEAAPPCDKDYNPVPYQHYEVITSVQEADTSWRGVNQGLQFTVSPVLNTRGEVIATVSNSTGMRFSYVDLACVYYLDQKPVGISNAHIQDFGSKDNVQFYTPVDGDYNEIIFDDYEVLINGTCQED